MLLVRSAALHARHSGDHDFSKPQKFHIVTVPRIGGVGIFLGVLAGLAGVLWSFGLPSGQLALALMGCAAPAFLAGVTQDMTEALTPRGRLVATAISAALAFYFLGAGIRETAIPGLDWVVSFGLGAAAVTIFAVAGVANAVNIIDGFNGLASMCVMLMLGAVVDSGYTAMTPIQAKAIPIVLAGRDVMGAAQTGTGKTAAFTLPLLQKMLRHENASMSPARHPVRALVLAPTR